MSNFKNVDCHDKHGKVLNEGDVVIMVDIEDLEWNPFGDNPEHGEVLVVTKCKDPEPNEVSFRGRDGKEYGFYGHRVEKIEFTQLASFQVKFEYKGFKFLLSEHDRGLFGSGRSVGLYQLEGAKKDFIVSVGWTKSDLNYKDDPEKYGKNDIIKGVTTWNRIKEEAVVYLSKVL